MSSSNQLQSSDGQSQTWTRIKNKILDVPFVYPLLVILTIVILLERPGMLKPLFFFTILRQALPLMLVTIGQSLCMRVRSIDLSSPGVIVLSVYIVTSGLIPAPAWLLCLFALAVGAIIGAINAWFIGIRHSSAVLVTLATAMIAGGIVLILSGIRQPGPTPDILKFLAQWRAFGFPALPVVVVIFASIFALWLRQSVLNRVIDAIGANPTAAWVSGLPYLKTIFSVHIISGTLSALAGVILAAALGKGSVTAGADLALYSLAAVVLGGVSFGVSRGGVIGPVIAAAMMTFLFNFLTAYDVQQPVRLIIVGVTIVLSAIIISARNEAN